MYSKITWITEINNCNIAISEKPKGNKHLLNYKEIENCLRKLKSNTENNKILHE